MTVARFGSSRSHDRGERQPLPWDATGQPHQQGAWTYQFHCAAARSWQLRQADGPDWAVLYTLSEEPQHASDVEMANHFTSTHPSSPFLGQAVVMRKTAHLQYRLRDRQLTTIRADGPAQDRTLDDAQFAAALRDDFQLALSPAELAELTELTSHDANHTFGAATASQPGPGNL